MLANSYCGLGDLVSSENTALIYSIKGAVQNIIAPIVA